MQKIDLPIEKESRDSISPTNPDFGWFGKMLIIIIIIILFCYSSIFLFSYFVIKYLPIEKEKEIVGSVFEYINIFEEFDSSQLNTKIELNDKYTLLINNSSEVNAFMTLGGNILINKGLIESFDYEEELLFVIGLKYDMLKIEMY